MQIHLLPVIVAIATALLGGHPASAATALPCPQDICACLGAAGRLDVLALDKLKVGVGHISYSGYGYRVPAGIAGGACGQTGVIGGSSDALTELGALTLLAPSGTAVRFKAVRMYGYLDPGTDISGDLVTGGGLVAGETAVTVEGATDTSGSNPAVADCQQATTDLQSASSTLAGLTPSATAPAPIVARGGSAEPVTITTGPGTYVYNVPGISIRPKRVSGYAEGSELIIDMAAGTDAVIINTPTLRIANASLISVDGAGADASRVIINVTQSSGVRVSKGASVEPSILAAASNIVVSPQAQVSNLYGRKVTIKGAQAGGIMECSPSGSFVDDVVGLAN